jgi:flagellar hook-length control protein FliK
MTINVATISPLLAPKAPAVQPGQQGALARSGTIPAPTSFAKVLEHRQTDRSDSESASDNRAGGDSPDHSSDLSGDGAPSSVISPPADPTPSAAAPTPDAMAAAAEQGVTAVLALIGGMATSAQPSTISETSTPVTRSVASSTGPGSATATATAGPTFAPIAQLPSMTGATANADGIPATPMAPATSTASPAESASTAADGSVARQDVATLMASLRTAFAPPPQAAAKTPAAPDKAAPTPTPSVSANSPGQPAEQIASGLATPDMPFPSTDTVTADAASGAAAKTMPAIAGKMLPTSDDREIPVADVAIATARSNADANAMPAIESKALPVGEGEAPPVVNAMMAPTVADNAIPNLASTGQFPASLTQHPAVAVQPDMPLSSHISSSDEASGASGPKHAHADTASPALDAVTLTKADAGLDTGAPSSIGPQGTTQISSNDATTSVAPGPTQAEQSMTRHLDLARDNQWLDRLAHDITQAATTNGHLKFQLNPEHLGSLQVEIVNSAAGTSVRMTADNDAARTILADAQPRLIAEVRAQGLRIAESHVDLGSQTGSGGAAGGQHQSSEDHKPFVRTQAATRTETPDSSTPADDELYA